MKIGAFAARAVEGRHHVTPGLDELQSPGRPDEFAAELRCGGGHSDLDGGEVDAERVIARLRLRSPAPRAANLDIEERRLAQGRSVGDIDREVGRQGRMQAQLAKGGGALGAGRAKDDREGEAAAPRTTSDHRRRAPPAYAPRVRPSPRRASRGSRRRSGGWPCPGRDVQVDEPSASLEAGEPIVWARPRNRRTRIERVAESAIMRFRAR